MVAGKVMIMNMIRHIILMAVCAGMFFFAACSKSEGDGEMNAKSEQVVRTAHGGGRWFPGSAKQLETMVGGFIDNAGVPAVTGRIVAAIAPHAGYIYSGKVAGHTFRAIKENAKSNSKPDVVVVLGFCHRAAFKGVALMDGAMLKTPMGDVVLDQESAGIMIKGRSRIAFNYAPHEGEHSAENEVPFVQSALPGVKIVVGLMGDHDAQTLAELVSALNELAGSKKVLAVASTDMLHHPDYDLVTKTDLATLKKIGAMDSATLIKEWNYTNQFVCGIAPVLAVMRFAEAQGCKKGTVLLYRNSGDEFPESRGDYVVGYGAVVFAN